MTVSKETVYELGVAANLAHATGTLAASAGSELAIWAIANVDSIPQEMHSEITRVLEYFKRIGALAKVYDTYSDVKVTEFGDADRAGMVEVSKEIGQSVILRQMQEACGMDDKAIAEVNAIKEEQMAEYIKQEN